MGHHKSLAAVLALAAAFTVQAQTLDEDALIEKMRASMQQQGQTLSAEQELGMRLKIREMLQRMQSMGNGALLAPRPLPIAPSPAPQPQRSTADLQSQLAALPPAQPVQFEPRKDGFVLNGRPVLDPEGKIRSASVDPLTGDFSYLIPRPDGSQALKRGRGLSAAITVGHLTGRTGQWTLQTADGQLLSGDGFVLTSRGALLLRESSAFEFHPGQAVRTLPIPAGWTPVPLQRGDVSGTGVLMLEKDATNRPAPGLGQLMQGLKRLTGSETPDDYALLHLETGRQTPLALSIGDKQVTRLSDCRRQNAVVNKCSHAESYDSLWNPDGSRNSSHYFWQAQWFSTTAGPVAVVRQRTTKEVRLFDLATGKEVVAFRRPLGIVQHEAVLTEAGKLRVSARLVFTTHVLEDARALLDQAPDQRGIEPEGTIVNGQPEGASSAPSSPGTGS